jgi:hypothetical protein
MTTLRWLTLFGLLALSLRPSDSGAQDGGVAASPATTPCSCKAQDKLDMEERIRKLQAADVEYDNLIKYWSTQPKTMLNESLRTAEEGKVNSAMAKIKTPGATRYSSHLGGTDAACTTWVSPGVPTCMRAIIANHEAKHAARCRAHTTPGYLGFWVDLISKGSLDWRSGQTILDYLKEEKADHAAEVAEYQAELAKMKQGCKTYTVLDISEKKELDQALAQRDRMDQAEKRLVDYGNSLS